MDRTRELGIRAMTIESEIHSIVEVIGKVLDGLKGASTSREFINLAEAVSNAAARLREISAVLDANCPHCRSPHPSGYA